MSEANKQVIRRLYGEVMAKGNMKVADEIFPEKLYPHVVGNEELDFELVADSARQNE